MAIGTRKEAGRTPQPTRAARFSLFSLPSRRSQADLLRMEHPSGASASVSATLQGSTIFLRTASPTSLRPTTQRTATRRSNRPLTLPIQTASDGAAVSVYNAE